MAARRPEPGNSVDTGVGPDTGARLPLGLRSPRKDWRAVGIWRPFAAVVAALLLPAIISWPILLIAGTPGIVESDGLRHALLIVLTILAMTPVPGWLALPVAWPLVYALYVRGWAGMLSCLLVTWAIGLPAAHWLLNGDITTEAPTILPLLILALAIQGIVGWIVLASGDNP